MAKIKGPKKGVKGKKTSSAKGLSASKSHGKKSILPKEVVELERVLKALFASPNFEFLKTIELTKLLGVDSFGSETLDQCAISDLVIMGGPRIYQTSQSDLELVKKLHLILANFVEDQPEHDREVLAVLQPLLSGASKPIEREKVALWSSNSVEIEKTIVELFQKLVSADNFAQIKYRNVGEYWGQKWHHYPFIESLTFAQLVDIKPKHLFQKRSFSVTVAGYLIEVLRRVVVEET